MVELICTEGLYEGKNVAIAHIAECNLLVVGRIDPEEHILMAIMRGKEFCHQLCCASSLSDTVTGRC